MAEEEVKEIPSKKRIKGLTNMFKTIKGAGLSAGPLGAVFKVLSSLEPLLKPLEVVMKIVGALFAVMAAEILPPLMTALQPLFDALMEMMPFFAEIGVLIGEIVTTILPPLIEIFIELMPTIKIIIKIIVQLLKLALIPLIPIFKVIGKVLIALTPLFEILGKILIALEPVIEFIGNIVATVLLVAIKGVAMGIAILIDAVTFGFAGAVNWVKSNIMSLQGGGIARGPVTARVGDAPGGELIAPLTPFNRRLDNMIEAQEQTNIYLKEIRDDKKFRHDLRRGF